MSASWRKKSRNDCEAAWCCGGAGQMLGDIVRYHTAEQTAGDVSHCFIKTGELVGWDIRSAVPQHCLLCQVRQSECRGEHP